ncbi:hypothetical protein DPEC_G00112740 [Dallia pectoralis]|uniref:Uncharacterized protein n=1 Tax=Dallia pectoralis TaxID=75939 RepID=A0ACC2GTR5_DALPE|nr:hypothetical protein DPEC_G00112740 [Dallia pectoralis]
MEKRGQRKIEDKSLLAFAAHIDQVYAPIDYSNDLFDCQSPTFPFLGGFRALHLLEDLLAALEMMDQDEREGLRCQIPDTTADDCMKMVMITSWKTEPSPLMFLSYGPGHSDDQEDAMTR